ncbi:MAG: polymer-forming cytoskeletal protein [Nitrospinota bacterium]|nr:polymer-forming cytoskeletal protein [Nitrospinota bacterium]
MRDTGGKDVIKAFLGEDTEFSGTLTFGGTVRIDGLFEGKIETSDNLIIGDKSKVKAEINVGTLLVQGVLTGDVVASKRIHITSTGKLYGNIATPALNVEDGAVMQGGIKMLSGDEPKAKPAQGSPAPAQAPAPAAAKQ